LISLSFDALFSFPCPFFGRVCGTEAVVFAPLPRRAENVFFVKKYSVSVAFLVKFEEKKGGFDPGVKFLN